MPIPVPVELDQPAAGGGLLAQSRPLPPGWERGIEFLDTSCVTPVLMGECPDAGDLKPTVRVGSVVFRPVEVITALECSTLDNRTDWDAISGVELDRTRDDALARELLTGATAARDAGPDSDPNPALVNTASDLGDGAATVTAALGCLEAALAAANTGRGAVLLMPIAVAYQAFAEGVLYRDGARWRTVTGASVIVSGGFDGRAPTAGQGDPPEPGDNLYVYATTAVWAGVGARSTLHDVDRAVNTVHARAEDVALVAFGPCAVFAVGTPVTACDLEGT